MSKVVWRGQSSNRQRYLLDLVITLLKLCYELTRRRQVSPQGLTTVMMNIVVDKSTDQECRLIKLNMADEFVATLVGITV